ncbi:MAG: hypothetical protein GX629_05950 [Phycisphaerae bacterium]|jgi:hypothetical protein|nr:hypothetical protein [Phycisphaerae bacterium]
MLEMNQGGGEVKSWKLKEKRLTAKEETPGMPRRGEEKKWEGVKVIKEKR